MTREDNNLNADWSRKSFRFVMTTAVSMLLISILSVPAVAATYIVNTTADPTIGDATYCEASAVVDECSFRDALAAADQSAELDTIQFDVTAPIHIAKQLTASHPIRIEGASSRKGKSNQRVQLRVVQEYTIALIPDRFEPHAPI